MWPWLTTDSARGVRLKELDARQEVRLKDLETRTVQRIELLRRDILIKLGGIVVAGFAVMAAMVGVVITMIQL
ncbi:MAG: hypothetical protein IID61_13595 [SAR324 cluster bacterium]|nr:hypothetical protein [SAR324 cluster bacterium]